MSLLYSLLLFSIFIPNGSPVEDNNIELSMRHLYPGVKIQLKGKVKSAYTESFFAPGEAFHPKFYPFHVYHINTQNNILIPEVSKSNRYTGMKVDFNNGSFGSESDPLIGLHDIEADLRKKAKANLADLKVNLEVLKLNLEQVFSVPRNFKANQVNRESVGSYIYGRMGRMGLMTYMQAFKAQRPNPFSDINNVNHLRGANAIGVFPGKNWGTRKDRPIVVGAHWDTVKNSPGLDDNGSGTAAMLEIASTLVHNDCFVPNHSIIFVAFDLEEPGCYGSLEFIRRYLLPEFQDRGVRIQAAIILDTIMNYDEDPGSQDVPNFWKQSVPKVTANIDQRARKGDFIGVIGRAEVPVEMKVSQMIKKYFYQISDQRFHLENFDLNDLTSTFPSIDVLNNYTYFWRSDNSRFWYYRDNEDDYSLGGVLITDTAFHRGSMRKCYHMSCDSASNFHLFNEVNLKFIGTVTQSVTLAVAEMAEGIDKCNFVDIKEEQDDQEAPAVREGEPTPPQGGNEAGVHTSIGKITVNFNAPTNFNTFVHPFQAKSTEKQPEMALILQEKPETELREDHLVQFLREFWRINPATHSRQANGTRNSPMIIKLNNDNH